VHTVWKGAISFGLVTIPVKLHAATEDKGIKLRQIHNKCKKPIPPIIFHSLFLSNEKERPVWTF